ncbi:MAG TPA: hypothetical protein VGL57_06790 [Solirubrobacteraceae bacterium]
MTSGNKTMGFITRTVLATLAIVVVTAGSAAAFTGYGPPSFFGAAGSGTGQFSEPAGLGVDEASGDVYIYDSGNLRVQWFDAAGDRVEGELDGSGSPSGRFASPSSISEHAAHGTLFNLAVDNDLSSPSAGDVYVVDPGHNVIDKFSATGGYLSQLVGFKATIFGVAVDSSGDLWVSEEGEEGPTGNHGSVQEYSSALANVHIGEISPPFLRSPGIALDAQQNLYMPKGARDIAKFSEAGGVLQEEVTTCECVRGLAVDTGNNDLFSDEESLIARYGPFGEPYRSPIESLEGISASRAVAVNGLTHTVYASQLEADTIAVFKFGVLPDVTTGPPSEQARTTAEVQGEVNPDGQEVTSCQFEYGASSAYGQSVPCATAPGAGSSPTTVTADLTGLTAQSTYHYRLVAVNAQGAHAGADQEFTTLAAVEEVQTEGSSAVTAAHATVEGSLEPGGFDTHYFFEYNQPGKAPAATLVADAGSASKDVHLSAELENLEPRALYLYRLVGENQFGRTTGEYRLLRTPVLAPMIEGAPAASFITSQSADLSAALNPENTTTHYRFEYGPCPSLAGCEGIQSTAVEASAVYGHTPIGAQIGELAAATTYSYRLIASNRQIASCEGGYPVEEEGAIVRCEEGGTPVYEGGDVTGPQATFTTAPQIDVQAATGLASAVTATSAVISGTVDPDGQPATYTFEMGVYAGAATMYGVISSGPAGSGASPVEEVLPVGGLQPGVIYAYRVTIHSGYGEAVGAMVSFTTLGLPAALSSPGALPLLGTPNVAFPKASTPVVAPRSGGEIKTAKLKNALRGCRKHHKHAALAKCEKVARARYSLKGPAAKSATGRSNLLAGV